MKEPKVVRVTAEGRERRHPSEALILLMLEAAGKPLCGGVRLLQGTGADEWAVDVDDLPYTEPATFAETVAAL